MLSESCCASEGSCNGEEVLSTHDYVGQVSDEQKERCEKVREMFKSIESYLIRFPECGKRTFSDRCISTAKTELERACMYTIKAVVFEGKKVR